MEAEIHTLILGFDQASAIQDILSELIRRKIDISAYVDSNTLFDVVAKDSTATEKRPRIYIWALKESQALRDLRLI